MPIGFELDGIKFSPNTLLRYPKHAALLSEVVTSFSLLEGVVGGIYGILQHQDIETAIEELEKLHTNAKRVEAVRKKMANNAELSGDPKNDEIMKSILRFAEKRNKIAHGIWGRHSSKKDILYRLPVKKWIVFISLLLPQGAAGNPIEKNIKELKTHMDEYSESALQDLRSEGITLLEMAMALFNKLAMDAAKSDGCT